MTGLTLGLILLSALAHASWNLLLKRSENKEIFAWGLPLSAAVVLAPLGGALLWFNPLPAPGLWLAVVSAGLQMLYFILLGRGYERGDLSLVYPIARGIGTMLVPVLAALILRERVELPAVLGIVSVVAGIYTVSWWGRFREILGNPLALLRDGGVRYAVLTGLTITAYTLVDKRGVEQVEPFLYMYLITVGSALGLAPYILRSHGLAPIRREWQKNAWPIVASGLLFFTAYGLALTAFSMSRVSYAAPAREVGIVVGVLMGFLILKEPFGLGRLLGSGFIALGLALIALSP